MVQRFAGEKLLGIACPNGVVPYVKRKAGETEDELRGRAEAEAEKNGGFVVLLEDRGGEGWLVQMQQARTLGRG